MNSRDRILSTLRANGKPLEHPQPWQSQRNFPDPVKRFSQMVTAGQGEVFQAESLAAALEQVEVILHEVQAKQVVVNPEEPFSHFDPAERWPDFTWHVVGQSEGDLRDFCTTAEVGLSGAEVALAETGSVIVDSGPERSRLATLLPPIHLVVVSTSKLTSDLFTWTAARQGQPPANRVIVSGPSKTADIEQILAIGVHGPKRFIVVLYED